MAAAFLLFLICTTLLLGFLLCYFLFSKRRSDDGRSHRLPPGPMGWPILGNLPQLGAKPHQTLHALSNVYGPLFRLRFGSFDVIVAASGAVAAQFLRAHDANFSNRPPNSTAEHMGYNYQDMVFAPYGPRWRLMRKLCALHLFSSKALDNLRHVRESEISILARTLRERARSRCIVNLGQALNFCITNALSKSMLGLRVFDEEEKSKEAGEFKEMVLEILRLAGTFNVGDFVPALRRFDPQGVIGNMKKMQRRIDSFLNRVIDEHRAAAIKGDDLLSVFMRLKEEADSDDDKLTDSEIKAVLWNMFLAGTDTTSSTVEWAIAEMIRNPETRSKAQAEMDLVVGRDRLVRESDLPNLPYLQAVVKEVFRLHPPTPLSLPRIAAEPCEVNGYHIPKNATLLVNVWAIARDPAVWADPLEFRPARFLPGGGYENIDVKGNDFEVIPFGAGRRICVGVSLGLRMVQFVTATLVHAFDWGLPEGETAEKLDMEEAYGLTLQRAVPLTVHPIPRLAQKAYETVI